MQRVLILGCCGAGKSTLAKQLSEATGLGVIHLDQHYWKTDWEVSEPEEWGEIVRKLVERPRWIMDGNYAGTLDVRLLKADTVLYLDFPTATCLWRITKRIARYWGRTRPDMTDGCRERFDLEFYHYVATFNATRRPAILTKLAAYSERKDVRILKSDAEINRYLQGLEPADKAVSKYQ